LELLGDVLALERYGTSAINEDRRHRRFARARQAYADICVLALPWTIDDAAHYSDAHRLDTRIVSAPERHLRAQPRLNVIGQLLKKRAGSAPAARARHDHRRERAQPDRLQDFLRDLDLGRARFSGRRR